MPRIILGSSQLLVISVSHMSTYAARKMNARKVCMASVEIRRIGDEALSLEGSPNLLVLQLWARSLHPSESVSISEQQR